MSPPLYICRVHEYVSSDISVQNRLDLLGNYREMMCQRTSYFPNHHCLIHYVHSPERDSVSNHLQFYCLFNRFSKYQQTDYLFPLEYYFNRGNLPRLPVSSPSKKVSNARHPVVYISDNILIRFTGMLVNYQLDAPSYQNLYNSLKAGYW